MSDRVQDHLPECPFDAALAKYADRTERQQKIVADLLVKFDVCICPALRACEHRARDAERRAMFDEEGPYTAGFNTGVQAARDAVAALRGDVSGWTGQALIWQNQALAAIDALRGESNDRPSARV